MYTLAPHPTLITKQECHYVSYVHGPALRFFLVCDILSEYFYWYMIAGSHDFALVDNYTWKYMLRRDTGLVISHTHTHTLSLSHAIAGNHETRSVFSFSAHCARSCRKWECFGLVFWRQSLDQSEDRAENIDRQGTQCHSSGSGCLSLHESERIGSLLLPAL